MTLSLHAKPTYLSVLVGALFVFSANANANANEVTVLTESNYQKLNYQKSKANELNNAWRFFDLYENTQGDYLKLSGRLQLDSTWVDSDQGDFNDTLWRRFRFGFKGKVGEFKLALEADFNLNNALTDSYKRLTDANISWALDKSTELKFLKQSAGFTLDGKTSSTKLLTPERNNLTNNLWFTTEYFTGLSVKGELANDWRYKAGVFSSDGSDEISIQEASYFTLFSTTKKLVKNDLWDKAEAGFDYVYNDNHQDGATRDYTQVISVTSHFEKARWVIDSDLSWGDGDLEQSDLFGLVIMPSYKQNEKIQWVARYTYLKSKEDNGIRLGRYEQNVSSGHGNQYREYFGGVNYYFNKHKLKLQAGIQYAQMDDSAKDGGAYDGWGLTIALRSHW